MVAASGIIKTTAKTALRGNWLRTSIASLCLVFCCVICEFIASLLAYAAGEAVGIAVSIILGALFCAPLLFGVLRYFWRVLWNQKDDVTLCFYYFSSSDTYLKALKLIWFLLLRCGAIAVLLFLPAILTDVFSGDAVYTLLQMEKPFWISNLWIISSFLKSVALIALFFISLRFYLAPFLLVSDEQMDPAEALHMSETLSKRTSFDFIILIGSFILWILLSVLMLPLPFTLPYFLASYLVHCRFAVAQYNRLADSANAPTAEQSFKAQ